VLTRAAAGTAVATGGTCGGARADDGPAQSVLGACVASS
jgi:hypothetical protein